MPSYPRHLYVATQIRFVGSISLFCQAFASKAENTGQQSALIYCEW